MKIVLGLLLAIPACGTVAETAPDAGSTEPRWGDDLRLTNDPAESLVTYNFAHTVATGAGGEVHVVWYDGRDGSPQIYYKRSLDGGATWGPDQRLVADATAREHPTIAISGDTVLVAWHELRPTGFYIVAIRSIDGGASWLAPVTLTTTGASAHASIAADADAVHVVWGETIAGVPEIAHRASTNRGETWGATTQISSSPYDSWVPNVAIQGDHVIVSWVDYRDANEEEYQRRSPDGGTSWGAITRLTTDAADSWAPCVAIAGDVVHLFWFDRRNAEFTDLDVEAPLDQAAALVGITVEPIPPRDPAVYYLDDFQPRLERKRQAISDAAPAWVAAGGDPAELGALLQQYQDRFAAWAMGWELYYRRSTDGGESYGPDTRMTTAPFLSQRPSVVAVGDRVDVAWFDGRDGAGRDENDTEIYYRGSSDGGQTWAPDLRLTTAPGASRHASIAATADRVHVIWYDARDGQDEIYYKRLVR